MEMTQDPSYRSKDKAKQPYRGTIQFPKSGLRQPGVPPWKLVADALCPSFLGSKHICL